jgi:hypothetical protein
VLARMKSRLPFIGGSIGAALIVSKPNLLQQRPRAPRRQYFA